MSRKRALQLLALCALLRAVSLWKPCLSDDEATYAVVGREMLSGHALYRDVVDHKPPAIYIVNEMCQAIGGPIGGMILLHALLILVVWATGMLLAAIVRRFDSSASLPATAGPMAALLWIVFTTTLVDVDSLAANCELFMMLPLVASVYMFLASRWIACGALVGAAMLFKYQAGIQLPLYGLVLIARERSPMAIIRGALIAAGLALPIAAAVGWLYARGAWDAAWFWFRFNFAYIDAGAAGALVQQMLLRVGFVLVACAALYVLAVFGLRRERPLRRFTIAWLVASAAAIVVGGRFFGHYFHQLTAPLAVAAAPAALAWYERNRRAFIAALAVPAAIFIALAIGHDAMMRAYGEPDPDYASVAAYLDAHGAPGDALCIWGNSPVLYFEADRPLGCRFVFANYMTGASPATPSQKDPHVDSTKNIVPIAWDMLEADLSARRPTFLVDASPGDVAYYGKYPPDKFPRLAHILACDYQSEVDIAGMRIYRRLATSRCHGS